MVFYWEEKLYCIYILYIYIYIYSIGGDFPLLSRLEYSDHSLRLD